MPRLSKKKRAPKVAELRYVNPVAVARHAFNL